MDYINIIKVFQLFQNISMLNNQIVFKIISRARSCVCVYTGVKRYSFSLTYSLKSVNICCRELQDIYNLPSKRVISQRRKNNYQL